MVLLLTTTLLLLRTTRLVLLPQNSTCWENPSIVLVLRGRGGLSCPTSAPGTTFGCRSGHLSYRRGGSFWLGCCGGSIRGGTRSSTIICTAVLLWHGLLLLPELLSRRLVLLGGGGSSSATPRRACRNDSIRGRRRSNTIIWSVCGFLGALLFLLEMLSRLVFFEIVRDLSSATSGPWSTAIFRAGPTGRQVGHQRRICSRSASNMILFGFLRETLLFFLECILFSDPWALVLSSDPWTLLVLV